MEYDEETLDSVVNVLQKEMYEIYKKVGGLPGGNQIMAMGLCSAIRRINEVFGKNYEWNMWKIEKIYDKQEDYGKPLLEKNMKEE